MLTKPDGERVLRTVTSVIGRDGRITQHVEERSLGWPEGRAVPRARPSASQEREQAAPSAPGVLADMLRALATPYIAAAAASAMRVLAAAAVGLLRTLLRRILGGR